jgi:hypothetical protein
MPELTSDDVVSGFMGLTVVRALRNARTPAALKPIPTSKSAAAAPRRGALGTWSKGASLDVTHITTAIPDATAGGGTLTSSEFMRAIVGPSVRNERPTKGSEAGFGMAARGRGQPSLS